MNAKWQRKNLSSCPKLLDHYTPEPVRSLPQLRGRGLRFGEAALVKAMAHAAGRLPLGETPPAQAARRLRASTH